MWPLNQQPEQERQIERKVIGGKGGHHTGRKYVSAATALITAAAGNIKSSSNSDKDLKGSTLSHCQFASR